MTDTKQTVLVTKRGDFQDKILEVAEDLEKTHGAMLLYVDVKVTGTNTTVRGTLPFAKGEYLREVPTFTYTLPSALTEGQGYNAQSVIEERIAADMYGTSISTAGYEGALYKIARDAYYAEARAREELFKRDLLTAYALPFDKKFVERMYEKAWARGHDNGFYEILSEFDKLVDFLDGYDVAPKLMN